MKSDFPRRSRAELSSPQALTLRCVVRAAGHVRTDHTEGSGYSRRAAVGTLRRRRVVAWPPHAAADAVLAAPAGEVAGEHV